MMRKFITSEYGGAAAEMALITPLALLLFFSAVETGHYFFSQQQLVKAVRDGARYGARQSFDRVNCRSGGTIETALQSEIRSIALTGQLSGSTETRSGWDSSEVSFTVSVTCPTTTEATSGIYETLEPAPIINIAATIGYNSLFNGLGIITDSANLNATQQASVMGI
ncbi:hypothetical protein BPTFM16_01314 [Altererythrobacter insulae]|nr:hypothetical protein BPTFM16_01314 [Altererythrobacter insulae]